MKRKYFVFAAIATMLASCSKDEERVQQDIFKDTPIAVSVDVAELISRAGYANDNLPATFYLTIDQDGDKYDYADVAVVKADDSDVYTPQQTVLWESSSPATAMAATFNLAEELELMVETDQSTEEDLENSDHLYMASVSVDPADTEGVIPVGFEHFMSKVNLTVNFGGEFEAEENPITSIAFKGTLPGRTYDYSKEVAAQWTDIEDVEPADIIPLEGEFVAADEAEETMAAVSYEVLLVPQTVAAHGFAVEFIIGGQSYTWRSDDAVTLEGGYQYNLTLTVGKEKMDEISFSTSAWGDGGHVNKNTEITE